MKYCIYVSLRWDVMCSSNGCDHLNNELSPNYSNCAFITCEFRIASFELLFINNKTASCES